MYHSNTLYEILPKFDTPQLMHDSNVIIHVATSWLVTLRHNSRDLLSRNRYSSLFGFRFYTNIRVLKKEKFYTRAYFDTPVVLNISLLYEKIFIFRVSISTEH